MDLAKVIYQATIETVDDVISYKVVLNNEENYTVDIYRSQQSDGFRPVRIDYTTKFHTDESAVKDLGRDMAASLKELEGSVVSVSYDKGPGYAAYAKHDASKPVDGWYLTAWAELPYWVEAWQMDGNHVANGLRLIADAEEKGDL